MYRLVLLLLLGLALPGTVTAYSDSFEERISKQIAEGQVAGEVVWLRSGSGEFLSLYRDQGSDHARGAVILLHGMGGHPDWPDVIRPLRESLPALGWASLSLQMPVLSPAEPVAEYGKTMDEARSRIEAGIRQLKAWNFSNIIIVGYGFGAATAAHALSLGDQKELRGFVAISIQAQQFLNPRLKLLKLLESLNLPVLDIYGSRDVLKVRREVHDRRLAARKNGNSGYRQKEIEGADHYYTGLQDVLIKDIQGWLLKVAPQAELLKVDRQELETGTKEEENKRE